MMSTICVRFGVRNYVQIQSSMRFKLIRKREQKSTWIIVRLKPLEIEINRYQLMPNPLTQQNMRGWKQNFAALRCGLHSQSEKFLVSVERPGR